MIVLNDGGDLSAPSSDSNSSGKIKLVPLICFWKRDNAEISLATMPRGVGEIVPRTVDEDVAFETCDDRWEEP